MSVFEQPDSDDTRPGALREASRKAPAAEPAPGALDFPVHPLSMDVGGFGACTVRADGSAACWQAFEYGQRETPPGVYSRVEVGHYFACALRNDATVHCWGGIPEAPPGRYVDLIAGNAHACGLTPGGRIDCWGENFHDQAVPPSGTFRSLGDGDLHSCAIRTDDKVVCWGLIGDDDKPPNKKFQSISGGANYTCGLLLNGELECWGTYTRPVTPPGGKFTSFATGTYHACALRSNGEMVCWGFNREGEGVAAAWTLENGRLCIRQNLWSAHRRHDAVLGQGLVRKPFRTQTRFAGGRPL